MEKKMTKREVISMMLADETISTNEVYRNYLENELTVLNRKAENRKPTKTQEENETLIELITNVMSNTPMTVTEIMKSNPELATLSNQKVSALVRKLVADGVVVKTTEKSVSKFALV